MITWKNLIEYWIQYSGNTKLFENLEFQPNLEKKHGIRFSVT